LKTIVVSSSNVDGGEEHLLISASRDGVIAFWDLNKNEKLLFSSPCISGRELTCVDVYNPSLDSSYFASDEKAEHDMMYFGTSDGYVVGYDIQTVLNNGECTEPDISFRAHGVDSGKGEGITAIKCGGDEATPTSGNAVKVTSTILLTGGEDGSVKQWLVLLYFLRSLRTKMKMSFSR
jgi:WD40 repeat protein